MAVDDTFKNIFDQLAALKAEVDSAYGRGYQDGLAQAVMLVGAEFERAKAVPEDTADANSKHPQLKARRGSVPSRILDALEQQDGATYHEIATILDHRGVATPLPSLRSAMRRLVEGGRVRNDGSSWFLIRSATGSEEKTGHGGAPRPTNSTFIGSDSMPPPKRSLEANPQSSAVERGHWGSGPNPL